MMRTHPLPPPTGRSAPWTWFALGALASTLWVLLHQWPARWLAPVVHHLSEGRVQLIEAQGTVREGSAHLALGPGPDTPTSTAWSQRLHWRLTPMGLTDWELRLRPRQQPESDTWSWRLQWHPSGWSLSVSDIDWRLPTAWLSGLGAPWNTVEPDGVMRLRSLGWGWQQGPSGTQTRGQIGLTLEGFATRLSSLRPLGDYQLTLHGATVPRVELRTLQGHLHLSGQGHWQNGRLQFLGEAWAHQAQDETALSNLLNVLGPRTGPRTLLKVG